MKNLKNRLKFGLIGAILGGSLAIVGFLIWSPQTSSVILFVLARALLGAIVAAIAGPLIAPRLF